MLTFTDSIPIPTRTTINSKQMLNANNHHQKAIFPANIIIPQMITGKFVT